MVAIRLFAEDGVAELKKILFALFMLVAIRLFAEDGVAAFWSALLPNEDRPVAIRLFAEDGVADIANARIDDALQLSQSAFSQRMV